MKRMSCIGALWVLAMLALTQAGEAAPFPRRGYIIDSSGYRADIGRRASRGAAQRAAMRMLSRLIRWRPQETGFYVSWRVGVGHKAKEGYVDFVDDGREQTVQCDNKTYEGVT